MFPWSSTSPSSPPQVSRPHVNSIHCRPADPKSPPKPAALQQHEQQQLSAVERGRASSLEGLFGADLKVEATREKDRVLIRIASKASESEQAKEQPPPPPPSEPPAGLLRKFVSGKDCVVGGSGWWRHELCFGSTVTQFHDVRWRKTRMILAILMMVDYSLLCRTRRQKSARRSRWEDGTRPHIWFGSPRTRGRGRWRMSKLSDAGWKLRSTRTILCFDVPRIVGNELFFLALWIFPFV